MKKYTKPVLIVERFELTQHIASCGTFKINLMGVQCVLNAKDIPSEMKDLAMVGFFTSDGGCPRQATDGAVCINASVNMAFTS